MMKIKGTHLQIPIGIPNLFQGKLKQTTVICLKLYSSFFFQNLLISCQKFPGRKSSLCMTRLRPRIRKIQIDPINLILLKNLRQQSCIHPDKNKIGKLLSCRFQFLSLLQRPKKHTVIHLNSHKISLRMKSCHIHQKTPLPHTNFQKKRSLHSKNLIPLSFKPLRLINYPLTIQNSILSTRNIS